MSATEVFQIVSPESLNTTNQAKRTGRTKRVYRCRHCARTFKRSEHCARHERVHTQERPFACAYCDRRYARKDLVKRHERSLHADAYRSAHPDEFGEHFSASIDDISPAELEELLQLQNLASTPLDPSRLAPSILTSINGHNGVDNDISMDLCVPQALMGLSMPKDTRTASISTNGHIPYATEPLLVQCSPHSSPYDCTRNTMPMFGGGICDPYLEMHNINSSEMRNGLSDPSRELTGTAVATGSSADSNIEVDPLLLLNHTDSRLDPELLPELSTFEMHHKAPVKTSTRPLGTVFETQTSDPPPERVSPGLSDLFSFGWNTYQPMSNFDGDHGNIPRTQEVLSFSLPKFHFSAITNQIICEDGRSRLPAGEAMESLFPTINDLNRFFSGYVECFHRHFPIIHLPSLEIEETPSPLIFAMCSIGAQYRLERQKAKNLFALAGTMSSYALRAGLPMLTGSPRAAPLWIMQTRVLLSLCGIFSEKASVVMRTVENLGLFAIEYRIRKTQLSEYSGVDDRWEDWISRESSKRLLHGMFIVSNLISVTYNIKPGFSTTEDLEFEALDDERLWNAKNAQEWREIKEAVISPRADTVRAIIAQAIFEDWRQLGEELDDITGFTLVLVLHAVNVHIWNLFQTLDSVRQTQPSIYGLLIDSTFKMLTRCENIIRRKRDDASRRASSVEGPLLFNCEALLQIAYTRLSSIFGSFDRLLLLSDNPKDVSAAVRGYIGAVQPRNPSVTKSVAKAYEGLEKSIKIGHLLLRKTAALSWSLEYAIAAWDASKEELLFFDYH